MSQTIAQDRLEIIVADDDPQSDFAARVSGWSSGRALYIRNPENLGLFPSINATISRVFNEDKKAYFPSQPLAEAPGILGNAFLARLAAMNPLRVPAVLIKRETIEKIGLFREDLPYCGDWEFWFRAATQVPWLYVPSAVAYFRVHARSQTRALMRTAQSAEDERRMLDLNEQALPPEMVPQIMPRARAHHAGQMLRNAKAALDLKLTPTAERYIREACAISPDAVATTEFLECLKHPSMAKLREQFRDVATRYGA